MRKTRAALFACVLALTVLATSGAAMAQGSILIEPTAPVTVQKGAVATFEFVVWEGQGTNYNYWVVIEKPNGRELTRFNVGTIAVSSSPSYHTALWTATIHPGWFRWRLYVEGYGMTGGESLRVTGPPLR